MFSSLNHYLRPHKADLRGKTAANEPNRQSGNLVNLFIAVLVASWSALGLVALPHAND